MQCSINIIYWFLLFFFVNKLIKQGIFQSQMLGLPHSTTPCPILIMPSAWLGSNKYQFLRSHLFDFTVRTLDGLNPLTDQNGRWTLNSFQVCIKQFYCRPLCLEDQCSGTDKRYYSMKILHLIKMNFFFFILVNIFFKVAWSDEYIIVKMKKAIYIFVYIPNLDLGALISSVRQHIQNNQWIYYLITVDTCC